MNKEKVFRFRYIYFSLNCDKILITAYKHIGITHSNFFEISEIFIDLIPHLLRIF